MLAQLGKILYESRQVKNNTARIIGTLQSTAKMVKLSDPKNFAQILNLLFSYQIQFVINELTKMHDPVLLALSIIDVIKDNSNCDFILRQCLLKLTECKAVLKQMRSNPLFFADILIFVKDLKITTSPWLCTCVEILMQDIKPNQIVVDVMLYLENLKEQKLITMLFIHQKASEQIRKLLNYEQTRLPALKLIIRICESIDQDENLFSLYSPNQISQFQKQLLLYSETYLTSINDQQFLDQNQKIVCLSAKLIYYLQKISPQIRSQISKFLEIFMKYLKMNVSLQTFYYYLLLNQCQNLNPIIDEKMIISNCLPITNSLMQQIFKQFINISRLNCLISQAIAVISNQFDQQQFNQLAFEAAVNFLCFCYDYNFKTEMSDPQSVELLRIKDSYISHIKLLLSLNQAHGGINFVTASRISLHSNHTCIFKVDSVHGDIRSGSGGIIELLKVGVPYLSKISFFRDVVLQLASYRYLQLLSSVVQIITPSEVIKYIQKILNLMSKNASYHIRKQVWKNITQMLSKAKKQSEQVQQWVKQLPNKLSFQDLIAASQNHAIFLSINKLYELKTIYQQLQLVYKYQFDALNSLLITQSQ